MDRPRPPPAADALYRAHHDRSTGWLTLVCQGRESKLYLQHGDVVGARLGFGHQTEAQALLAAGQLAPAAFDRLWVRGQLADLAALCDAAGLDPSALSEARTLASVRRLTTFAEEASFMPALVGVTLPRVRGARALRAAFEALSPVPAGAWVRCADPAAAEVLLGPGEDRAFVAGLSEFRSLDAVSPAQSALLRLLEHAGLAEVLDAEAWEARGRAEKLEAERRAEEQERRRAALGALEAARAAEEQRQADLRRRAEAARRALEAARAAEESWRRAGEVPSDAAPSAEDGPESGPEAGAELPSADPVEADLLDAATADTLQSPALEAAPGESAPDEARLDAAPERPAGPITAPEFPALAELDEPLVPVDADADAGAVGLADLTDEAAFFDSAENAPAREPAEARPRFTAPDAPGEDDVADGGPLPRLTAAPLEAPPGPEVATGRMGAPAHPPAGAWAEQGAAWTEAGQGGDEDTLVRAVQEVARTTSPEFPALPPPERTDPFARVPAGLGDDAPTPPRGTPRSPPSLHEAPTPPAGTSGPWADAVHVSSPDLHEAPTPPAGTGGIAGGAPTPPSGTDARPGSARTPPGGIVLEDEPVLEAEALVVPDADEPVLPDGMLPARTLVEDLTEALRRAGSEAPPELWSAPSTEAVGSRPAERAPLRLGPETTPGGIDEDLWKLVQGDAATPSSFEDAMARVDGQLESLAGLRAARPPEPPPERPEVVALPAAELDALVRTSFDSERWSLATPPLAPAPANPDSGRIPLASLSRTPVPAPPPARPDDDTPVELSSERRRALLRQAREVADTDPASPGSETPPPRSLEEAELAEAIEARHAALARPPDRFALLGLTPDAGRDEVKHAFLELVKTFHPDRLPRSLSALAPKAARVFDALREAQDVLLDDARRAAHAVEVRGRAAPAPLDPGQAADALIGGELAMRRRDYGEAEAQFERAWNADPRPATLAARAWAIYMDPNRKSEAPRARAMMVDALKMDADCDRAHYQLGVIARVEGDVDRVEKHFREAVRANPRHLEAAQELRLLEMRKRGPRRR